MRIIAAIALLTGCTPLPAYVPGSERVLIGGPENSIRIEMVKSAEKSDKPVYFIRITGTDREYEGYVLRYTLDTSNSTTHDWSTTIWGRERKPLRRDRANTDDPTYILRWRKGEPSTLSWAPDEKLDIEAMLRAYLDQKQATDALQAYDREREQKRHAKQWSYDLGRLNESCETNITGDIAWDTIDDESMLVSWLGCAAPTVQLRDMCREFAEARDSIGALERVVCRIGSDLSISLEGKTLTWTAWLRPKAGDQTFFKKALMNEIPWAEGPLAPRTRVEKTVLCTDGNGLYVGLDPQPWNVSRVIYGENGAWLRANRVEAEVVNEYFYDPRFFHPKLAPDLQWLSIVIADDKRCKLRCGERMTELQHVDQATKEELLLGKTIATAPLPRRPYGLARDREGIYYYVDVGPKTDDRDFRIFVGRKGAMERLDMVDLVTDSGGDIFVTRSGKLRLILGKETSYWIEGSRTTDLINLPVEDNLLVIYNQLGVYLGQPYGTPCDIF